MKKITASSLENYRKLFIILVCTTVTVIIFFSLAIILFPGGNIIDVNFEGFSFYQNTISEVGSLQTLAGENNTISFIFYTLGGVLMVSYGFFYYFIIWRFFQEKKSTKILSIIGSFFGILHASLYIGVLCCPVDIFTTTHNIFIFSAPGALFIGVLSYTIVFLIKRDIPKLNRYSSVGMVIAAFIFATVVTIGSILGEPLFSLSRKAGHTLFIFLIFIFYLLQAIGFINYFNKLLENDNTSSRKE